ncbi:MAG: ATP-binding protein [Lachnospiraceae bacterium]
MNAKKLSVDELIKLKKEEYILIDIRDQISFTYGAIKHAICIPEVKLKENIHDFPLEKKLIFYCMKGVISEDVASYFSDKGFDAYHLVGGYSSYLIKSFAQKEKIELEEKAREVEKSIRKKFHKELFTPFAKAIMQYDLLKEGDKVAICISGGKDSMVMAKLFQELKRHNKFSFELVFLVMDPGYNDINREVIIQNAKKLDIPITIFNSNIFDAVYEVEKSPCYLCARMRRGYLYNKAKELGCNKIALGHHYDDVIETILMGMMYGAQIQTMMPKLKSTNFEGMELIRPMYLIREKDILHWRDYNELHFIQCACKFTDTCTSCREDGSSVSKRMEIKELIKELKNVNPFIESNIFKSVENVNLKTIIAYKKDGIKHHFLDEYDI